MIPLDEKFQDDFYCTMSPLESWTIQCSHSLAKQVIFAHEL